jgi:hypothetical protein
MKITLSSLISFRDSTDLGTETDDIDEDLKDIIKK